MSCQAVYQVARLLEYTAMTQACRICRRARRRAVYRFITVHVINDDNESSMTSGEMEIPGAANTRTRFT